MDSLCLGPKRDVACLQGPCPVLEEVGEGSGVEASAASR